MSGLEQYCCMVALHYIPPPFLENLAFDKTSHPVPNHLGHTLVCIQANTDRLGGTITALPGRQVIGMVNKIGK